MIDKSAYVHTVVRRWPRLNYAKMFDLKNYRLVVLSINQSVIVTHTHTHWPTIRRPYRASVYNRRFEMARTTIYKLHWLLTVHSCHRAPPILTQRTGDDYSPPQGRIYSVSLSIDQPIYCKQSKTDACSVTVTTDSVVCHTTVVCKLQLIFLCTSLSVGNQ